MKSGKVIVRVKGGLGNQLFCYAAARRLAMINDAELVIDDVSGFIRDRQYKREYMLDAFSIPARKATPQERMEPFEKYRRGVAKLVSRNRPFQERRYIVQEGIAYDPRLLEIRLKGTVHIDGLWQSEGYFKDIESTIRQDLRMVPPQDASNREMAEWIRGCNSIGVHMRWFSGSNTVPGPNIEGSYYSRAVKYFIDSTPTPHFFLFSDDPDASLAVLPLPEGMFTCVNHNSSVESAWADLWLMGQCRHFIIANSTFSWWGAWLAESKTKIVIAPEKKFTGIIAWGFPGLIPEEWILVPSG